MINIYAVDLWVLCLLAGCGMTAWYVLAYFLQKSSNGKKLLRLLSALMTALAVYGILTYTVLNRNTSDTHRFVWVNSNQHEFFRELFMNGLLYLPFGLALSTFLGWKVIPIAFVISVGIEIWQFVAGTGLAQGTDVIMNTLGAFIGFIPLWLVRTGAIERLIYRKQKN